MIESSLGEKCWIDLDGIESDDAFVEKIITAVDACEVLQFMYSAQHADIKDYQKIGLFVNYNMPNAKENVSCL